MKPAQAALLWACSLWLLAVCAQPSPDALCAASAIDARIRLSDTEFVACYKGNAWDVLACPSGLLFSQRTQTCTP